MNALKQFKMLLLTAALPIGTFAQNVFPLDPAVRTGKLANGFTYFIRHNEEPKNRVLMYLVNKVGSVLEDEDQRGLAHFMEHMSFNGTKHFPHNQLIDYLQKAGVRFGADINAYTSFDETIYQLPIPSDNPQLLKKGLEIMRDWAQEVILDPVEIDKERGVVLEEKRLGKGAGERMQRIYWPIILNQSRYATRVPIGLDSVLNNFKRPALTRFYHDWYRPNLQALIIVGDINVNQVEKSIKTHFSDLKNPAHEKVRPQFTVPLTGKNQFVSVTDKEMTSTTMELLIKHKIPQVKKEADFSGELKQMLFNEMLTARYSELSRVSDPPFVSGVASITNFIGGLDCYDAGVVAKPGELEKGFKAVWRETERVKRFGFTATEFERAKAGLWNSVELSYKEQNKTNSEIFVKQYQDYFLKNTPAPGMPATYKLVKKYLPGITLAGVNRLAAEYIKDTDRSVLIEAPGKDKNSHPDEATVKTWLSSVENEKLEPYKDEVSAQPLLAEQPVEGKIVFAERNSDFNFTTITLSNGVKIILKPTDFKNNEIQFSAFAPGGTSIYDDADYQSAAAAAGLIVAGGAGNFNANQLQKFMSDKESGVSPFIADRYQGVTGSSTPKDLETALKLVYAYFTGPRKDTAVFKGMIEKTRAALVNRSNDPGSVFSDTVSAVLSNYNVRRTGPTIEKLNQVNLDRAYAIYRERFADAGNFTFTFVGSIDTITIKPLLEKYLGSLPAKGVHEQARDLGIHIPPGKIKKTVYKGSEHQASVLLVYSGSYDYSPENNVRFDALKEALEIRLLQVLRENESAVYTPGVSNVVSKFPQSRYSFSIRFGCAPQNVDKLVASTLDEISKLRTNGPPQENVDKWRAEAKISFEPGLKTNGFWLNYINAQLQNQDDIRIVNRYRSMLDEVKAADIKMMAARYLSGDNLIEIVLKPETDTTAGN